MPSTLEICEDVRDHLPAILDDWRELIAERPWLELPPDIDLDHLPSLVDALLDAVKCGKTESDRPRRAVIEYALRHGSDRRSHGLEDHVLFQEFHLLREAIWAGIRRRHGASGTAFAAIGRIDAVITAATRGSLHGYHRVEWDDSVVESLVGECSWPPEPA